MMLRPATAADLPALVRLNSSVQELHAQHAPAHIKMPTSDPACAEFFRQTLADAAAFIVVAEEASTITGYFFAQEVKREESWIRPALSVFMLEHLAVDTAFRRRGIGTALVGRFFEEARRRGIGRTGVVCWNFNQAGQEFFRRSGFSDLHARMERVEEIS